MKNLRVFIFQQNWFHLGSAVEAIIHNHTSYKSINFYYLDKNLYVKPLDRHQDFFGSNLLQSPPESIASGFLVDFFSKIEKNFSFNRVTFKRDINHKNLFSEVDNIQSLQKIKWGSTSIGLAVSSFLITLTKDSNPILRKRIKLIQNLELTYFQIFKYLQSLKLTSIDDEIWVCNGRPFHDRAIVEYAKMNALSLKYYEIGGEGFNQNRWILHENSPHNRVRHQDSIRAHFNESNVEISLIDDWFKSKKPGGRNQLSKTSELGSGPETPKDYFVYFSSSDDELSAISLDWNSSWGNQLTAVKALMNVFENYTSESLVIRVHPNQKNKSRSDKKNWKKLKSNARNITIFNYDSKINSYKLLLGAKGVFTFGSTIGVEAAYFKRPGALLANSRWDLLIPHMYLKTKEDILNWVTDISAHKLPNSNELEKNYNGSLIWGHYMKTAGQNWSLIKIKQDFRGVSIGYLDDKSLKPNLIVILITRVFRFLRLNLIESRLDLGRVYSGSTWHVRWGRR